MEIKYMACDGHKKYSVFVGLDSEERFTRETRVEHDRAVFRDYLASLPPGLPIAVEATGFYYWMVDEMEAAGHNPATLRIQEDSYPIKTGRIPIQSQEDLSALRVISDRKLLSGKRMESLPKCSTRGLVA